MNEMPPPGPPCCWPECNAQSMWMQGYDGWPLCFTHTAHAVEVADRIRNGYVPGEREPVMQTVKRVKSERRANTRSHQKQDHPGWVYYARVGGHIKIGYAADVRKRMRDYPPGTIVLAVEPGDKKLERARHKEFSHSLSDGREWFRESLPIREHIDKLRKAYGDNTDLNYVYKKHQRDEIKPNSKGFWLP